MLTVGHVNTYIKQLMDKDYILKNVWIQGEVSNYKAHNSGHLYFTLKDDSSAINCVMFRSYVQSLERPLTNGMKIMISGSVSVYERSGQYQVYVRQVKEDGVGALYLAYEKLKKQLESEGLFDDVMKKPIPTYAKHIGIVTSSTGAAIRDIVQVAQRRNPYVQLTLYPSLVQGAGAKDNIVQGIRYFNGQKEPVDVMIIGRGGGSIEDLWPFNEEVVARAISDSKIPIISAVGHETDFTIADFVADKRVPTPSAGAEVAVYDYYETLHRVRQYRLRLEQWLAFQLAGHKSGLEALTLRLNHQNPKEKFEKNYQYIAELEDRLTIYFRQSLVKKRHLLQLYRSKLDGLAPSHRLKNGYAYLSDEGDHKIDSIDRLSIGDTFKLTLSDGTLHGQVTDIKKEEQ